MTRILLAGATGLVGRAVLQRALASPRVSQLVAPTRRPLPGHARLVNPIVDFDALPADADWWQVDAVICALGTTIRDAGSKETFRRVDHAYPLEVAQHARAHGAHTYGLVSAMGADAASRIFYSRTKGELERDLQACGFASLIFVRPGLLGGERAQRRTGEWLASLALNALEPVLPQRYRVVPAERVAEVLLAAVLAAAPGTRIIESGEIR